MDPRQVYRPQAHVKEPVAQRRKCEDLRFFCLSNYYTTVICLSRHLGYEAGYHIYDGNILTLYTCNRSTRGVEFATLSCAMVRTHAALVIGCHRPDRARCCVAAAYKLTNMEIKRSLNLDDAKH